MMGLRVVCHVCVLLSLVGSIVAPSTRSGRDYGTERRRAHAARTSSLPYNSNERGSRTRTRRTANSGRPSRRDRDGDEDMVEYPLPPVTTSHISATDGRRRAAQQHNESEPCRNRSRGRHRTSDVPSEVCQPRRVGAGDRRCNNNVNTTTPVVVRAPAALFALANSNSSLAERVRRWDNPDPSRHPCVVTSASHVVLSTPRPVPPPVTATSDSTAARTPAAVTGGSLVAALPPLTTPPPPLWHSFLRDLVTTLGYTQAVSIWPRLTRCTNGAYSADERSRQNVYMNWCRNILIGFERYRSLLINVLTRILFN